jgi:hypothetical protein
MLIVEDLMLLMLDDRTGTPAGAGTLHYALGGAVLVELALLGRVETDGAGPKVLAVGAGPLPDPLLQSAHDRIAEKPRRVQSLLLHLGGGLYQPLRERLIEQGHLRREKKKVLGLFSMTLSPANDTGYESALRQRVAAVLEDGASPDARTAAVIALLSSSGTLPSLHPVPKWSAKVYQRAKELEQGSWGAEAVNTAVTRTAAAIAAASTAVVITTVT